jgi:methylmalonyl-CoA mutase N-terminal domain/subunit
MDEALALPTQEAARLALRTQQILAYESGVAHTADPLGGSYAVESLTNQLEREAEALIARVDALGGMVPAIETGFVQREIQEAAYTLQRQIETQERVVVGVNRFRDDETSARIPIHRVDPALESEQLQRLQAFRRRRNQSDAAAAQAAVRRAAEGRDNLMPPIVEAVDRGATLGEISDVLRDVFGEYRADVTI